MMGLVPKVGAALALAAAVAATAATATTSPAVTGAPAAPGGPTCDCGGGPPPSIAASYDAADLVVRATAVNGYTHGGRRYYTLAAVKHLKGCPSVSATPTVVTANDAAGCGARLRLDVPALLFIRGGMALSACDANMAWAAVPRREAARLEATRTCGGGCAAGEAPHPCGRDPCGDGAAPPPCASAVKCVVDRCGGCWARWLTAEGEPVACNTAPALGGELGEPETVGDAEVVGA